MMPTRDRRGFLNGGATLGSGVLASPVLNASLSSRSDARTAGPRPKHRTLGTGENRLEVSSLGRGCMGMSYHRSLIPERRVDFLMDGGVTAAY